MCQRFNPAAGVYRAEPCTTKRQNILLGRMAVQMFYASSKTGKPPIPTDDHRKVPRLLKDVHIESRKKDGNASDNLFFSCKVCHKLLCEKKISKPKKLAVKELPDDYKRIGELPCPHEGILDMVKQTFLFFGIFTLFMAVSIFLN